MGMPQGSLWFEGAGLAGDPHGSEGGGDTVGAGAGEWCFCPGGPGRGAPQGSVGGAGGWGIGAPQGSDGCDLGESKSRSPVCWGF